MRTDAKGAVLFEGEQTVTTEQLRNLTAALGTGTAADTAAVLPFFGPTIGSETTVTNPAGLALDLSHALLAGLSYDWQRPFQAGETVGVRVVVEDVHTKGNNTFGVVAAEFTDATGQLIHRQTATFVERGAA